MSKGFKVSKEGIDVKVAANKDLLISSQFDTIKVKSTGVLELQLPAEDVSGEFVTHTATVAHGFSDIPLYSPTTRGDLYGLDEFFGGDYFGKLSTGGDYVVNDISEVRIPAAGYSPATVGEMASVFIDSTNLILQVDRFENFGFPEAFGARKATLYYTIFYNRIDEAMEVL